MKKYFNKCLSLVLFLALGLAYAHAQENQKGITEQGSENTTSISVFLPAGPSSAPEQTAISGGPFKIRPEGSYIVQQGSGNRSGCNVLLLLADDDATINSPIQALLLAYGDLGSVDIYDARYGTPNLTQLQAYDVVITWSNYFYNNPVAIGDVLADYVDAGGKVINMNFSMGTHGWQMGGRFINEAYTAMNVGTLLFDTKCLGTYDAAHPIMAGITNVCDYFRTSNTYLTIGSSTIAYWSGGEIFVAAKNNQTVVSINGYVGYSYQWTGQMPDVLHNAILWLCEGGTAPVQTPINSWALYLGIGLIFLFAIFRIRKIF